MQTNKNKENIMENKQVDIESVSINDVETGEKNDKPVEVNPLETRISELTAELAETRDKYLRAVAELENTRRRAAIDADARARARAMSVAESILPVMDAVDAALKHNPDDAGIQSMAAALRSAFDNIGIVRMESLGKPLNPSLHNAIQAIKVPDGTAPNTIVEEMQPGYMFGDNVLRTAMVVVAK